MSISNSEDLDYVNYLTRIDNFKFSGLNRTGKVIHLLSTLLVGFIGYIFLITSFEVLTELYILADLIESFFELYELTSNSFERILAKSVFALCMGLIYVVLAFFVLVIIKCSLFLISFFKPLELSNAEKKFFSKLKRMNMQLNLNPLITRERKFLLSNYSFKFTEIYTELDLEELIIAIKPSISLIGIQITIGSILFFLFSIPLITYYELVVGLTIVAISGIFSIFLVKNEIINPILTFWQYYSIKKLSITYFQDQVTKIALLSNTEDNKPEVVLEFLALKEKLRDLKNMPTLPISNIIKLWTIPGLIISFISLVL